MILVCADAVGVRGHIAAGNEGYVAGGDRRERVTFAGDIRRIQASEVIHSEARARYRALWRDRAVR
jgi:hypothetical protein